MAPPANALSPAGFARLVELARDDWATWGHQLQLYAPDEAAKLRPPAREVKRPGLLRQIGSAVAAVARHVAHGLPLVTHEEKARRLEICRGCPDYLPDGRCGRCGCVLNLKAAMELENCPVGKW